MLPLYMKLISSYLDLQDIRLMINVPVIPTSRMSKFGAFTDCYGLGRKKMRKKEGRFTNDECN